MQWNYGRIDGAAGHDTFYGSVRFTPVRVNGAVPVCGTEAFSRTSRLEPLASAIPQVGLDEVRRRPSSVSRADGRQSVGPSRRSLAVVVGDDGVEVVAEIDCCRQMQRVQRSQ